MAHKMRVVWWKVLILIASMFILLVGLFVVMNQMKVMTKLKEKEMMIRCLEIYSDRETYPEQECEELIEKMRYN